MKLNFKEWNIIMEAVREKAESIEFTLRYYNEECDTRTKYLKELETVKALIAKIENLPF